MQTKQCFLWQINIISPLKEYMYIFPFLIFVTTIVILKKMLKNKFKKHRIINEIKKKDWRETSLHTLRLMKSNQENCHTLLMNPQPPRDAVQKQKKEKFKQFF